MPEEAVEQRLTQEQVDAVAKWAAIDPEHGTTLKRLLATDEAKAASLFSRRLAFGTAGLRGPMRPGPNGMNRLVVRQTTRGLMDWLQQRHSGIRQPVVVIGFDARHHSMTFAYDVAAVVEHCGGRPTIINRPLPTPVLARAIIDNSADAGVMITASHNPSADNGYKLYLGDGIQIIPPTDSEIAEAIDLVSSIDPLGGQTVDAADAFESGRWVDITDDAVMRHRNVALQALVSDDRDVAVVYTAMHGVGGSHLLSCMRQAGFPEPLVVEEQFEPHPGFPTVAFPNPEEDGAMDKALALAAASDADIALANDPDADRLGAAVADRNGRWSRLTGDEIGVLLADHVLRHARSEGRRTGPDLVASSIVSSRLVSRVAIHYGAESIRTLTGFKWVARAIVDRSESRYLLLGYEEALGYCVGDRVRDKDGISAALVLAELVAQCKAQGLTLRDRLDALAERHGLFLTSQVSVRFDQVAESERAEAAAAAAALDPLSLAGVEVVRRRDLSKGDDLPPTAGVVLDLADDSRVIVRPSGTEPKVKAYLEVVAEVSDGGIEEARRTTNRRLANLTTAVRELLTC